MRHFQEIRLFSKARAEGMWELFCRHHLWTRLNDLLIFCYCFLPSFAQNKTKQHQGDRSGSLPRLVSVKFHSTPHHCIVALFLPFFMCECRITLLRQRNADTGRVPMQLKKIKVQVGPLMTRKKNAPRKIQVETVLHNYTRSNWSTRSYFAYCQNKGFPIWWGISLDRC